MLTDFLPRQHQLRGRQRQLPGRQHRRPGPDHLRHARTPPTARSPGRSAPPTATVRPRCRSATSSWPGSACSSWTPRPDRAPDKPGNIVKLRSTNSAGSGQFAAGPGQLPDRRRPADRADQGRGQRQRLGAANPANTDHVAVREGDSVVFRVDATNNGTAGQRQQRADHRHATCGTCCRPGSPAPRSARSPTPAPAPTRATPASRASPATARRSRDRLDLRRPRWPPAATKTFNYTVTIPAGVSVSTDLTNTAAVRVLHRRTTTSAAPAPTTRRPTSTPRCRPRPTTPRPPADNSDVYLRDVAVTKGVVSAINETGNIGAEASPASEHPGHPRRAGHLHRRPPPCPAHSTVFNATFSDPLPTGLTLNSATGDLPAGRRLGHHRRAAGRRHLLGRRAADLHLSGQLRQHHRHRPDVHA